jgi:cephalosporin-C deacetylase-like acetyl esterase
VALTLTDFELWTVTAPGLVTAGLVEDTVFVRVFVVVVVRVLVVVSACDVAVVRVPGSDFAGAVTLLACAAALETFWLAF